MLLGPRESEIRVLLTFIWDIGLLPRKTVSSCSCEGKRLSVPPMVNKSLLCTRYYLKETVL